MSPVLVATDVNLLLGSYFHLGPLAQSVEQRTFNPWVVGSIPTGPTIFSQLGNWPGRPTSGSS